MWPSRLMKRWVNGRCSTVFQNATVCSTVSNRNHVVTVPSLFLSTWIFIINFPKSMVSNLKINTFFIKVICIWNNFILKWRHKFHTPKGVESFSRNHPSLHSSLDLMRALKYLLTKYCRMKLQIVHPITEIVAASFVSSTYVVAVYVIIQATTAPKAILTQASSILSFRLCDMIPPLY